MGLTKRSVGCSEINGTMYIVGSSVFDVYCDTAGWSNGYNLQIIYTVDFPSCINGCAAYEKCVGVRWVYEQYGPTGVAGGSECFFLWAMPGNGSISVGEDSARLQSDASVISTARID